MLVLVQPHGSNNNNILMKPILMIFNANFLHLFQEIKNQG